MHKNKTFYQNSTIELKGKLLGGAPALVMGIINLTPDSFYAGSRKQSENEILETAAKMISEGADLLDLGAYSSRLMAENISEETEWERMSSILPILRKEYPSIIISIDTFRANVAEKALNEGADIINDISAGSLDEKMFPLIVKWNCPYIMMHMKGTPQTMSTLNQYSDLVKEVIDYFEEKINLLQTQGFQKIIIDPGFGFAKVGSQNFELLSKLGELKSLRMPILAGLSRKSMIYKTLNIEASDALNGTTALNMVALQNGTNILRVHDVKEAVECVKLYSYL